MTVLGFDVGGANIKIANDQGEHQHQVFELWMRTCELPDVLRKLIEGASPADRIALTMTGELTDCFKTKQEGVEFIIDSMLEATDLPVSVYLTGDEFVVASVARSEFMRAAASNWYGLASFVSRMDQVSVRSGLLIDIGSTTCDIIPFGNGQCLATGSNDFERLKSGELVYTGALRSPLCGIVDHLMFRGDRVPVMNELFASMLDVNIILGRIPAGSSVEWAADHCGTSVTECLTRISRLLGLDRDTLDLYEGQILASQIRDAQLRRLEDALAQVVSRNGCEKTRSTLPPGGSRGTSGEGDRRVTGNLHDFLNSPSPAATASDPPEGRVGINSQPRTETPQVVFVSGQGEFTARELCERFWQASTNAPVLISMNDLLGPGISSCAPAYAIARLAQTFYSSTNR